MATEATPNLSSFSIDNSTNIVINISYTNRIYQCSNVIIQDPGKEGILSFFNNMNYNSLKETKQTETQQSTTPSSGQSTGMY